MSEKTRSTNLGVIGVIIVVGIVIFAGYLAFFYVDLYNKSTEYKEVSDVVRNVSMAGNNISVVMGTGSCCENTYFFSVSGSSIDEIFNIVSLYKGEKVTILYKYSSVTEISTFVYIKPFPLESSTWG